MAHGQNSEDYVSPQCKNKENRNTDVRKTSFVIHRASCGITTREGRSFKHVYREYPGIVNCGDVSKLEYPNICTCNYFNIVRRKLFSLAYTECRNLIIYVKIYKHTQSSIIRVNYSRFSIIRIYWEGGRYTPNQAIIRINKQKIVLKDKKLRKQINGRFHNMCIAGESK
jgi:hypothetical protein